MGMNLVVDVGNSRGKAALFGEGGIVKRWTFGGTGTEEFDAIFCRYGRVARAVLSSTRGEDAALEALLRERSDYFLKFTNATPIPLQNAYATPQTLGSDRLAAAVGARELFPERNLLVVDFGTAVTCDIVTAGGCYLGGSISPGLSMRLRALADYTGRLPLLSAGECVAVCPDAGVPSSTATAMAAGTIEGIELEVRGRMERYVGEFAGLVTIFTGGDAPLFEKRFKNTIFANCELVLTGLNTLLDYNADRK